MNDYRQTQGNRKLEQIIGDLMRSKEFKNAQKKILRVLGDEKIEVREEPFENIIDQMLEDYFELLGMMKSLIKKTEKTTRKITDAIAIKYGIESDLLNRIIVADILTKTEASILNPFDDLCLVNDDYDENYSIFPRIPFLFDTKKQQTILAFPISIRVNKNATKRDVLDFIEKRWEEIGGKLEEYRDGKRVIIRKRKLSRELIDFLWNNQKSKPKELKKMLNEKFPKNSLSYSEISKYISRENKRRNGKLV